MSRSKTDRPVSPAATRLVRLGSVIVAIGGARVTAWAQQQADVFLPRTGPPESVATTPLVFAAYAFVWVALTGYVFLLWRRIGKVEEELRQLRQSKR